MSLPRLLAGLDSGVTLSLAEHQSVHGAQSKGGPGLFDAAELSGLRGRGGASFPTAAKLRSVARQPGSRAVLVNAAEGESMSFKDRLLLERTPHLVLDGALAAASAVEADEVVIAVRDDAMAARDATRRAIKERRLGRRVKLKGVPPVYLGGQEGALIRYLNGGPLKPSLTPPLPFERGLRRRPTLVQNPETLAHLALIDRHGPAWFRQVGTAEHPGSALVTVSGAVGIPGVQEIACGARLEEALGAAGARMRTLRAVLVGGFHGTWIPAESDCGGQAGRRQPASAWRQPRRGRDRRPGRVGVSGSGAGRDDGLARGSERAPVRALFQRPARPRRPGGRHGGRSRTPGLPPAAVALVR